MSHLKRVFAPEKNSNFVNPGSFFSSLGRSFRARHHHDRVYRSCGQYKCLLRRKRTFMLSITETASLVLVGAFWGCTNPLLRKGSTEVQATSDAETASSSSLIQSLIKQVAKFRHISVWLPYALNQTGSILFYVTLSHTDLSLAVPACNALSLVFSIVTSWWILKEPVDRPVQTVVGAALVMGGVALCLHASETSSKEPPSA